MVWIYCNTPYESTHDKLSFLVYGVDSLYPTESAFLSPYDVEPAHPVHYQQELILTLLSARELVADHPRGTP